jgi:hypothetical protein
MIERLRQEPEHVRFKYVSLATLVCGGALVLLWGAVLLPLQLRFGPGSGNDKARQAAAPTLPATEPAVAGTMTAEATPTPSVQPAVAPLPLSK